MIYKHAFLLTLLLAFTLTGYSQTFEWSITQDERTTRPFASSERNLKRIVTDQNENVYAVAYFSDTMIINSTDPNTDSTIISSIPSTFLSRNYDLLITKYAPNGSLLWAKQLGDGKINEVNDIKIDSDTNLVITGRFWGGGDPVDFDPGPNTAYLYESSQVFFLKIDKNGDFIWVKTIDEITDNAEVKPTALTIDKHDNIIINGTIDFHNNDIDLDPSSDTFYLYKPYFNCSMGFTIKLDKNGTLIWGNNLESNGGGDCYYKGLSIDSAGNIYGAGYFHDEIDFDPSSSQLNIQEQGDYDCFVTKFDQNGDLIWVKTWGGQEAEYVFDMEVDRHGNVYTIGQFQATTDFDPSPAVYELTSPFYDFQGYVHKLDMNGNFQWVGQIGYVGTDYAVSIDLDDSGRPYIVGSYDCEIGSIPFYLSDDSTWLRGTSHSNYYILGIDTNGNYRGIQTIDMDSTEYWIYSYSEGFTVHVSKNGYIYATGFDRFHADYDLTDIVQRDSSNGTFLLKYNGLELTNLLTTSISEPSSLLNSYKLYPNPNRGAFSIELDKEYNSAEVSIYDMSGKKFFDQTFFQTSTIKIQRLPHKGLATVFIKLDNMTIRTFKIVIE